MAQASNVAIGAAAALVGGFIGGWLQGQTARDQAEPLASPGEGLAIPEEHVRFLGERREHAYAAFGGATYAFLDSIARSTRFGIRPKAEELAAETTAMRNALMTVKVVGSEEQAGLAEKIVSTAEDPR